MVRTDQSRQYSKARHERCTLIQDDSRWLPRFRPRYRAPPRYSTTCQSLFTMKTTTINQATFKPAPIHQKTITTMTSDRSEQTQMQVQPNKENGPDTREDNRRHNGASASDQRAHREKADVTVVVGGREFFHYSQVLCLASDFFEVALKSGMKEAETMRIEFPEEDPCEWELFASFLEPFSQAKITQSNVVTLIPWFHKLGITSMLNRCDRVFVDTVSPPFQRRCWKLDGHLSVPDVARLRNKLHDLLHAYAFSSMYDLTVTKERATRALRRQITCSPDLFDRECIDSLVTVLEHEENRETLWSSVKEYIPADLQIEDSQYLVSNKLFPYLLHTWMQNSEASQNGMYYA